MIYDEMVTLCDQENIILSYDDLKMPLNGTYISLDGVHTIIIANRIKNNHPLRNVVLAEEIGHHFTLSGNNLPTEHWNRLDRINFTKDEARAIRWAATYLIPKDKLIKAGQDDFTSIPALAEYFNVTLNFMQYRLLLPDIQALRYQAVI